MNQMSTLITMSLEMIRRCNGHEDAMDAFLVGTSSIISMIKLLMHRVYWKQKSVLVKSVIHDWTYEKNAHSRDIMLKYARIGRIGSSIFFYFCCASVASRIFIITFSNINLPWTSGKQIFNVTYEKKMILSAYCVFGKYTSSFAYCAIEVLQFVQLVVNTISQCGNDGLFFDLTMHMCGQFAILQMNFNALGCDEFPCRSKLDVLLKRHYHLICLSHYLERAFTLVILAQVLMSVLVLCIEGSYYYFKQTAIKFIVVKVPEFIFVIYSMLFKLYIYIYIYIIK